MTITLPEHVADALTSSALAELRPAKYEATALIVEGLRRRGLLERRRHEAKQVRLEVVA